MNSIIKKDLFRYKIVRTDVICLLKMIRTPGAIFMYFHRKTNEHASKSFARFIYKAILRHLSYKFGFQIPISVKIGEGFNIAHFGVVIINSQVEIGKNCNISPGVTIGGISIGQRQGTPKIGDYVWMGANSIIVGGIEIGSNVLIAPGAFVNFDVPDNSLVIGNPGRIIYKKDPVKGYINHVLI
jgi:serine O-acetyltransferase